MAYVKQDFRNGNVLDAGELSHIEDGVVALERDLNEVLEGLPGAVEQATPTISVSSGGLITASATQEAGVVPAGTKSATQQLNTRSAQTITPGTTVQEIPAGVYLTGKQTISAVQTQSKTATTNGIVTPDTGKYLSSVVVNVPAGGSTINAQSKTVTPTKSAQTVTPDNGYNALSSVTVNPIPNNYIVPSGTMNITNNGTHNVSSYESVNVSVPSSGVNTSDADATAPEILSGKTAYVKGNKITGTMANRGTMNRTLDGFNTTSVPVSAGYYSGGSVSFDSTTLDGHVQTQADLIQQIKSALARKAAGGGGDDSQGSTIGTDTAIARVTQNSNSITFTGTECATAQLLVFTIYPKSNITFGTTRFITSVYYQDIGGVMETKASYSVVGSGSWNGTYTGKNSIDAFTVTRGADTITVRINDVSTDGYFAANVDYCLELVTSAF